MATTSVPQTKAKADTLAIDATVHDTDLGEFDQDGFALDDPLLNADLGQYRLGPVIGRGSMSRVYRAEHTGLIRPCAIKIMNPALLKRSPTILEDFWAEARAIARLIHPHVVTVHNLGSALGFHFIEMEYIEGGLTLREELIHNGPMNPIRVAAIVRQVVLALGAAHRAGLIHRDVKPSNVLLAPDEHVKLADFGLARRLGHDRHSRIAGTPSYMAPELFQGVPACPRTDIYAVGVMMYYLLTGRLPLVSDSVNQLIGMHKRGKGPNFRDLASMVPDEVLVIVERCLAPKPERRYASAYDLAQELQTVLFQYHDTRSLVRECLEGLDAQVRGGPDHFVLRLLLEGGRAQEVHLEIGDCRRGCKLVSVYSICAPADPDHFEFALTLNAELTCGSLSIRELNQRRMFVMARTFSQGRVSVAEIREAIWELAKHSDDVEHHLTRADHY